MTYSNSKSCFCRSSRWCGIGASMDIDSTVHRTSHVQCDLQEPTASDADPPGLAEAAGGVYTKVGHRISNVTNYMEAQFSVAACRRLSFSLLS